MDVQPQRSGASAAGMHVKEVIVHKPSRVSAMFLALSLGAISLAPLWALPRAVATPLAGAMHLVLVIFAAVALLRSGHNDASLRRSRLFIAAALGAATLGFGIQIAYILVDGRVPNISLVDPVMMSWVPLAALGLLSVPSRDGDAWRYRRMFADGGLAASALLVISWILVLRPLSETPGLSVVGLCALMAYPICDIFVAAIVFAVLPRIRADARMFFTCASLGLVFVAVSDSGTAVQLAQRGSQSFGWPDVVLQAGLTLLAFGAFTRTRPGLGDPRVMSTLDQIAPYCLAAVATGVLVAHVRMGNAVELGDFLVSGLMFLILSIRQFLTLRELGVAAESHLSAATHDALTGIANRKAFMRRLVEHLSTPGSPPAAVLFADLDGFKVINDTLGHDMGDRVLQTFARRFAAVAGVNLAARLGGDEFAVLVVAEDPELAAELLAAQLVHSVLPDEPGHAISCSVGIAAIRPGDTAPDILRRADLAMYTVKRSPGLSSAVFTDSMAQKFDRQNLLVAHLRGAVSRGQVHVVYQPIYGLAHGELAGAEALVRWTHPLLGVVPPDEFIPLSEANGDIVDLGAWVLDTAVAQVAEWQARGRRLPQLFVNVAAAQFTYTLPDQVADILHRHGLTPDRLSLEVTESQMPLLSANLSIQRLRQTGVRIALDDFGSKYSSLAQLATLPVDILKIDRDFIVNLNAESGRAVLDAVVALAKALGLITVAEGIESRGQAAEVTASGVDLVQGYLFSRPIPAAELWDQLAPALATPTGPSPDLRSAVDPGRRVLRRGPDVSTRSAARAPPRSPSPRA